VTFFATYRRVLGLLRAERSLAIVLAAANVAVAALQYLEPVLFGRIIDVLTTDTQRSSEEAWGAILGLLVLWGGVGLTGIVANILVALHADRLSHRRRLGAMQQYFEHVLSLPIAFHRDKHSGRLLKVMLQGVDHLFGVWLAFFREHLATFVALLILLPLSLALNWRLGLLLVALILVFAFLAALVVSRTEKAQRSVEAYHSQLAMLAGDALGNVPLIHSFVRLAAEARQLGNLMRRLLRAQYPVLGLWALVSVLTRAASTLTVIAIFVYGTWLHLQGLATVGQIVSFMGFATLLIGRLEQAMGFISRLFFQMHAIGEFFDVLDTQSTVRERANPVRLDRVKGDVSFNSVTYSYDGERDALSGISFAAPAGSTVALVGTTGAGKTTAIGLLMRMADPQQGTITIDGVDIRDVSLESLRQNIGVVFQDSTLFHRTIAENLRIGKPAATAEELIAAAEKAEAHDFIMAQARGYDTLVGERGTTLSGGERQRLAIARALLKNPPILVLDEATSALDAATEARVQRALKHLMAGRTTFVIAHRLSTIRDAGTILVFQRGRIVEQGNFTELMARAGVFADLVATQIERLAEPTT
jgi:ATP-binding cassette subfamily B protein